MIYIKDNVLSISDRELQEIYDNVSVQRQQKADRYMRRYDKAGSLLAYLALQDGLEQEYGLTGKERMPEIRYQKSGKPVLCQYPHIHFNMSHCKTAAVCAISDAPVGIDVEEIAEVDNEIVNHVCNEEELKKIQESVSPETEFAILWTKKESLIKLNSRYGEVEMKDVLTQEHSASFETIVNRERGYVISRAIEMRMD